MPRTDFFTNASPSPRQTRSSDSEHGLGEESKNNSFSPSDAEKELFFDSSPSPCSLSLLLVWRGEGEAFVKKSVLGIETNPFPPSSDFRHRQSFAVTSA